MGGGVSIPLDTRLPQCGNHTLACWAQIHRGGAPCQCGVVPPPKPPVPPPPASKEVLARLLEWSLKRSSPVWNVLLCAAKGTGKSGFTNTLESGVQQCVMHSAKVRPSGDHVTRTLWGYSMEPLSVKVWDLWGWRGDCTADMRLVLDGRLREGAEWTDTPEPVPVDLTQPMHCVVLGLSYAQHNAQAFAQVHQQLRDLLTMLRVDYPGVRVGLLLTQCDLAADVAKDLSNFYGSTDIQNARTAVADALSLQMDSVLPVTTMYGQERVLSPEMTDRCWSICLSALEKFL